MCPSAFSLVHKDQRPYQLLFFPDSHSFLWAFPIPTLFFSSHRRVKPSLCCLGRTWGPSLPGQAPKASPGAEWSSCRHISQLWLFQSSKFWGKHQRVINQEPSSCLSNPRCKRQRRVGAQDQNWKSHPQPHPRPFENPQRAQSFLELTLTNKT